MFRWSVDVTHTYRYSGPIIFSFNGTTPIMSLTQVVLLVIPKYGSADGAAGSLSATAAGPANLSRLFGG
jgi:hypothetical protein